ncbi:MAG TPA: VWA domain-containing protein [Candidatus Acidoferrum sp.]|nr:VWA domain-containing protein [Candidatus Acidoferrum sp.]
MKRLQFLIVAAAALLAAVMVQGQSNQGQGNSGQSTQGQSTLNDEIRVASEPYTPAPAGAIRVQSNIVEVGVVVRDENGKAVPGLKKSDFQVFDSGKLQTISNFTVEEDKPAPPPPPVAVPPSLHAAPAPVVAPPKQPARYVGFYFDDINMKSSDLTYVRKAAQKFVDTSMDESDKVAVFTSSATVSLTFTTDKQKLAAVLEQIRSHSRGTNDGAGSCPHIDPYQAWQINQNGYTHTPALDLAVAQALQCGACASADPSCIQMVQTQAAMVNSLADQFALDTLGVLGDVIRYVGKMPGRRTLVMASSGFFSMSDSVKKQQDKLIDSALQSGIRINTLDAKGLTADWIGGDPANGPPIVLIDGSMNAYADQLASDERDISDDSMMLLAEGTGGTFFHNDNDITGGVKQLAATPAVSYAIGFSPVDLKPNGSYHTLKVKLANGSRGYSIEARPGYFAPNKSSLAPEARLEQLHKEVMASDEMNGLNAMVEAKNVALATGEPAVKVTVHVDTRTLPFKKEEDRHKERLLFVTALFDDKNTFLTGVVGVMDMSLKDATLAALNASGTTESLTLQAPPGHYRLREVVQEVVNGRITASSTHIEVH